jgi:hypothetical protein
MFPFTKKQWDDLIRDIENEADEIWRRDNA